MDETRVWPAAVALALVLQAASVHAQGLDGHISLLFDHLPNVSKATELRARVFAEDGIELGSRLRLHLSGFAEGLIADRDGSARDAIVEPRDLYADLTFRRFDLRAGVGRVVWGRLDELQPSDVINPLDVSRFFFEGRSEARLPVALVRARVFFSEETYVEAVWVPAFRRGRFDQLDEPTSPFNLAADAPLSIERDEPPARMGNGQGGVRFNATTGRVDWAVAAYRGFEPFGLYEHGPFILTPMLAPPVVPPGAGAFAPEPTLYVTERYPRFTLVSGDFETVRGGWALRGEVAAFVKDSLQQFSTFQPLGPGVAVFPPPVPLPSIASGRSIDAGFGLDRKAGDFRLYGTLYIHYESIDSPDPKALGLRPPASGLRSELLISDGTDVSLLGGMERRFDRDRWTTRVFALYNAGESSAFLRSITSVTLGDNVALEGSIGWFVGEGDDTISRFAERDFLYARLKVYF